MSWSTYAAAHWQAGRTRWGVLSAQAVRRSIRRHATLAGWSRSASVRADAGRTAALTAWRARDADPRHNKARRLTPCGLFLGRIGISRCPAGRPARGTDRSAWRARSAQAVGRTPAFHRAACAGRGRRYWRAPSMSRTRLAASAPVRAGSAGRRERGRPWRSLQPSR